ncbi:hypothetical protein RP20_CCG018342 [Aedes albopictus]|nr:hypothetical protein RP20_CCG018342 [Aedes albopictus]
MCASPKFVKIKPYAEQRTEKESASLSIRRRSSMFVASLRKPTAVAQTIYSRWYKTQKKLLSTGQNVPSGSGYAHQRQRAISSVGLKRKFPAGEYQHAG